MDYNEEDYLMLSGIQHFEFCQRQWALIHIEQKWEENFRTVDGSLMHKHAHDTLFVEKRGDTITTRGLPVFSRSMGVSGICDVVEFTKDEEYGVYIHRFDGKFRAEPVEYKHGVPKEGVEDVIQVVAEAMCLEEMLGCEITSGSIFYGETRHRTPVEMTDSLRQKVKEDFGLMHQYMDRGYTPKVKAKKACNACSLKNICVPKIMKMNNVEKYINSMLEETEL